MRKHPLDNKPLEIVLISHWFGHSSVFMECIIPMFLEKGCTVYHLTDKPEEADLFFQESLGRQESRLHHLPIEEVEESHTEGIKDLRLAEVIRHWKGVGLSLRALFARLGREVGIFHTWVDLFSHPLLRREVIEDGMPAPWTGLYVHPAQFRITKSRKRQLLETFQGLIMHGRWRPSTIKAFNSKFVSRLYFWDENIIPAIKPYFRESLDLLPFPDYCIGKSGFKEKKEIPELIQFRKEQKKILVLVGFLSRRKGLLTLMKVALETEDVGNWSFVFAGKIDWEDFTEEEQKWIKRFIENPPNNTLFITQKLNDYQFRSVLQNADLIYLAYENFFHSSGLQVTAAILETPIIAGPKHLIAERTTKYHLGWCLEDLTIQAVKRLLEGVDMEALNALKTRAKFHEFASKHSLEELDRKVVDIISFFHDDIRNNI